MTVVAQVVTTCLMLPVNIEEGLDANENATFYLKDVHLI